MKQYIKPLYILACFFFGQSLLAQPGNDGNMQVTVKINNLWIDWAVGSFDSRLFFWVEFPTR